MDHLDIPTDGFNPDSIDDDPIEPLNITDRRRAESGSQRQAEREEELRQYRESRQRKTQQRESDDAPAQHPERQRNQRQGRTRQTGEPTGRTDTTGEPQRDGRNKETPHAAGRHTLVPRDNAFDYSVRFDFFRDGRFSYLLGVVLLFASLYFLIACISFVHVGASDQSQIADGIANATASGVKNTGGALGAIIADTFIARWFGVGSFVIIAYLVCLGLSCVRAHKFNLLSLTVKMLTCAIAVSVVAGYISLHFVSDFHWGGEHGYYINKMVYNASNEFGALIVAILFAALIVIIFLHEIGRFFCFLRHRYRQFRASVNTENSRRRSHEELTEQAHLDSDETETDITGNTDTEPTADEAEQEAQRPQPAPESNPEPERRERHRYTEPLEEPVQAPTREEIYQPIVIDDEALADTRQPVADDSAAPVVADTTSHTAPPAGEDFIVRDEMPGESNPSNPVQNPISTFEEIDDIPEEPFNLLPSDFAGRDSGSDSGSSESDRESADENEGPTSTFRVAPEIEAARHVSSTPYDPTADLSHFRFPDLSIFRDYPTDEYNSDIAEEEQNKQRIVATLNSFGIEISHIDATIGPTVTLYEVIPADGIKIARIKNLEDDIARSIAARGTRVIAPIPGKETVGIEVPNKSPQIVPIKRVLSSKAFQQSKMNLPMAMGATIANEVYIADLTKMPHLLVAGATGMGKSVGLNTILASLLFKKHPSEVKFILIDPKMVEFSLYNRIENHYLAKLPDAESAIITDMQKVMDTLNSLCLEMDNRYRLLQDACVRQITEYNAKFVSRVLNPDKGHRFLPYIVVVVDEFADLIMTTGKEVEQPIARIAQKARAVGIHLILATQRPSTNVITGLIKANFPGRIAFRVFQMVDSRTILDTPGANQLIGRGDMLFSRDGVIERVQCALIETDEVEAMCQAIGDQVGYPEPYLLPEPPSENGGAMGSGEAVGELDPLLGEAARFAISSGTASASSLQTRYTIGYPRARKIMDQMEKLGIVGPVQGAKPRQLLVDSLSLERLLESYGIN